VTDEGRGLRFGTIAEQYDRLRPTPPPEALRIVGDVAGMTLLEVGAGTGIWTRFLHELGAIVTAVEPDDDMRKVLQRRSPGIVTLKGTAEHLALDDGSFDGAFVSSAWHWFRQPHASMEIARVLRDNGPLYVVGNGFSRDVAWISELADLRERPDDADQRPRGWLPTLDPVGPFIDSDNVVINWTRTMSVEDLVELFGTFSGAIIRTPDERAALEATLRQRIHERAHDGVVDVPMALWRTKARRRPR
jgi:SAM-dependent methyltransferase